MPQKFLIAEHLGKRRPDSGGFKLSFRSSRSRTGSLGAGHIINENFDRLKLYNLEQQDRSTSRNGSKLLASGKLDPEKEDKIALENCDLHRRLVNINSRD